MGIDNADFHLSDSELIKYQEWVRKTAQEDPDFSSVTVSFTFTPLGVEVIAHKERIPLNGNHLVIRDAWD